MKENATAGGGGDLQRQLSGAERTWSKPSEAERKDCPVYLRPYEIITSVGVRAGM